MDSVYLFILYFKAYYYIRYLVNSFIYGIDKKFLTSLVPVLIFLKRIHEDE